ncbi:MAG: cereblon family protein [Desulfovibrionaceae bacterium]
MRYHGAMPTLLLRPKTSRPVAPPKAHHDPASPDAGGNAIRCRACGHEVTTTAARLAVHGAHTHVFCNPNGNVFEIGCFTSAHGCAVQGSPTPEFTWFSGHAWQIALCHACRAHLGWRFTGTDSGAFFGLILAELVEDDG